MEQKSYPDVSQIFAAKEARRRQLTALSWEEKVKIIEKMREAMPRGMGRSVATMETEAQKLRRYRTLIKQSIERYAAAQAHTVAAELISIFDERNANYLLIALGLAATMDSYTILLHLRVKDNQIVIEVDRTEGELGRALIAAGIPESTIRVGQHEAVYVTHNGKK